MQSEISRPIAPVWFTHLAEAPALRRLGQQIDAATPRSGEAISARGANGSSTTLVAAALQRVAGLLDRPVLLVVAHLDEADEALDELEPLGIAATKFPAMELAPGASSISLDLLAERLTLVRRLIDADQPRVIIAPIQALMQSVPRTERLGQMLRVIRAGDKLDTVELARWLSEAGYNRVETID